MLVPPRETGGGHDQGQALQVITGAVHKHLDFSGRTANNIAVILIDGFLKKIIAGYGKHQAGNGDGNDDKRQKKGEKLVGQFFLYTDLHIPRL